MALANMTQEETNKHNEDYCRHIAHELEYYANGQMWRCEECGEVFNDYENGEEWNGETCPHCGEECDFEQMSCFDWLDDALDITYTMSNDGRMLGARVMVAFGGPSIYVDTFREEVALYWWCDRATWPIRREACEELDNYLIEYFEIAKSC